MLILELLDRVLFVQAVFLSSSLSPYFASFLYPTSSPIPLFPFPQPSPFYEYRLQFSSARIATQYSRIVLVEFVTIFMNNITDNCCLPSERKGLYNC